MSHSARINGIKEWVPKELGVQFPISVGNRGKYEHRMKRLRRQLPFLQSVLKEANRFKRQELLQHANADQVNAVSELVLNLLKQNIPITPTTMNQLRPHKNVLRNLARRKHSLKKRRQWLVAQKGWVSGKVSTPPCANVFDGETLRVGKSPARCQPSPRSLERGMSILAA